jgi:osmotically-inducible protein OsmY
MAIKAPGTGNRTDAEIFAEARVVLDRRAGVPGTVHVHVSQGTATLTGTVRKASERIEAEDAVRQVTGVREVRNDLGVVEPVSAEGFEPPDNRE